jgi:hypothetical protein
MVENGFPWKWYPWKTIQCDKNLGTPIICFHPSLIFFFQVKHIVNVNVAKYELHMV